MTTRKYLSPIAIVTILALALLFNSCNSSTDSSDEDTNDPIATFNSGDIAPGESFSYTFNKEGAIDYYCEIHAPDMQGRITVTSSVDAVDKDTVVMENNQFQPSELSVAPNTEVVWMNNEDHNHTVTSGNPPSDDNDDDGGGGY